MMRSPHFLAIFTAIAAAWVCGWGSVMFRYPQLFASINRRFLSNRILMKYSRMQWMSGPQFISFSRYVGISYMVLASLSVVVYLIGAAFGFVRF